jgi:hypothetical protein
VYFGASASPPKATIAKKKIDLTLNPAIKPSADLIEDYVMYADRFEIPRVMHESVIMSGIASIANGKVWIKNGGQIISLDTWMLLISRSASGRNTLVRTFRELLAEIHLDDLIHKENWGSGAYVEEYFSKNDHGFFIWPEMSQMMKQLGQSHFAGAREFITDLYDETQPPNSKHYRSRKLKINETPAIVFTRAPRTTFLASTSEPWFFSSTIKDDAAGGLIPRWCLELVREQPKVIPTPRETDRSLVGPMLEKMKMIAQLKGKMDLSNVNDLYEHWYRPTKARFDAHPNRYLAGAFWGRHRAHILKVATILELSRSATLVMSRESFIRAEQIAKRWEDNIFELLQTSFSSEGVESRQLEENIRQAGPDGFTKTDFAAIARGAKRRDMIDRLLLLIEGEVVFPFTRSTAGRSIQCLVHRDHLAEHKRNFPQDSNSSKESWR